MLIRDLPSHAQSVHRSVAGPAGTGNDTIYTVPSGRTLYITSVYIASICDGALVSVQAPSDDTQIVHNLLLLPGGSGTEHIVSTAAGLWRISAGSSLLGVRFFWDQPVTYGFAGWLD